jgi:hypothetical protein
VFRLDGGFLQVFDQVVHSKIIVKVKAGDCPAIIAPVVCGRLCFVLTSEYAAIIDWVDGKKISEKHWGSATDWVVRPCYTPGKSDYLRLWLLADARAKSPQTIDIALFPQ